MVSDDNTNTTDTDTTRRRGRIFGGRSRKRADEAAATTVTDTPNESVSPATPDPVAEADPTAAEAQPVAPASGTDAPTEDAVAPTSADEPMSADETTSTEAEPQQAEQETAPAVRAVSTTDLLFVPPPAELVRATTAPARGGVAARAADDDDDDDAGASGRRRRRRSRGGVASDNDASAREQSERDGRDDDEQGSTRTRSRGRGRSGSARREPEPITEPQRIKGSTRLEAKKQRRRDGRDAGRRRPVVTEAEFLARRESVDRVMVVRSKENRIQIGVLEDGVLVEHYVARSSESSLIGNVYLGKVQNVLPSMEAAFVDIGRGRNAVLYSGEVDWEAAQADGDKNQPRRIELALKPGDKVLVQVTKDPIGHKGARLTSQVSLPGRYLVYVPNGSMSGISRKLPDTERARLKKILKEVLPDNVGVIVRTAAEGATEEQLTRDVQRLTSQWEHIQKQIENSGAPALLHSEPDLLVKIVRDVFNEDFRSMVIHGDEAHRTITSYLESVAPDLLERVEKHDGEHDPFDEHRITEQIEKALERKVWLPSGGSLVIDRTEAMTVVDVNTGKFVGSGGNLEETVTKNNLEAAEEIVRQLRLRDIGGIIVVDFIDMVLETNRDLVLRRLVECLSRDRTKHQVAEVTSLGLVQMTRKRIGLGLLETFSETCDVCAGRGLIVHHDPVVKHRGQNAGGDGGRGNRRGGSANGNGANGGSGRGGNGNQQKGAPAPAAHAITEDVSKALATIAAKTVHHDSDSAPDAPASPAAQADEATTVNDAPVADAPETPVEILDIPLPVTNGERKRRAVDPSTAEQLLGSVLESLPEPPAPGTRKRASRRATTGTITATPSSSEETAGS
ncbi:Rne/Rng family ribonuclease [Microcella sp.]|uniref:Rne/Rng family ribonuclease n=1 Tax=Microcella sp. TaxID=1913979 RepID=UPI00391A3AAA